jgi:hypothetical protein
MIVGDHIDDLDPADGIGAIRVGSGVDTDIHLLVWNEEFLPDPAWVGSTIPVVHTGDTTPIILQETAVTTKQGVGHPDDGSTWGALPLRKVNECYNAGMILQYTHKGFLQSATGDILMNLGTIFFEFNDGDATPTFIAPVAGGIAETEYLHGGVLPLTHSRFEMNADIWQDLPLLGPDIVKDILYPKVVGFMDSGASSGVEVGYALFVRYIGVPV